jgi:hypothetical protein
MAMAEHGGNPDIGGQQERQENGASLAPAVEQQGGIEALRLPDARQTLDMLDETLLPKAIELGVPQLSEPRLTADEVSARYADLSRDSLSRAVGLDALRAEAQGGRKSEVTTGEDTESRLVVYGTREGFVKVSKSDSGPEELGHIVYEQTSTGERVDVQHHERGGGTRLFGLTLGEDSFEFGSERHAPDETRVHVYGRLKDDPAGNVIAGKIQTERYDG